MSQVIRREVRKRGFVGKLFKATFIIFNILMIIWLIGYWVDLGNMTSKMSSDAEKSGAALGATLGTTFIVFFWAAGDVVLGLLVLFTRGKTIWIEERE